jgi:hypothetical protein
MFRNKYIQFKVIEHMHACACDGIKIKDQTTITRNISPVPFLMPQF